jgi:hypothetical protein
MLSFGFGSLLEIGALRKAETIKGLERGLHVLRPLQAQPISSLRDIHAATRISKPSLLRILKMKVCRLACVSLSAGACSARLGLSTACENNVEFVRAMPRGGRRPNRRGDQEIGLPRG